MNSIADALVYAVTYINLRQNVNDPDDDSDVGALESVAGLLRSITDEELDALASAANAALAVERASSYPRAEFIRDYSTWMEDLFGDDWTGNART